MTTWEEIRDEVAGMLADGCPLEEAIAKLEQRKNEMAKANLLKTMDAIKKKVPMTNEECIHKCTRENLAVMLVTIALYPMDFEPYKRYMKVCHDGATEKDFVDITKKWLKEKHNG